MECQVLQIARGSDQWDAMRLCRVMVSRLGDVLAGEDTKRRKEYLTQLSEERSGHEYADDHERWSTKNTSAFTRAMDAYEWRFGKMFRNMFLIHHKYDWLASAPDLMAVSLKEGVEIACRKEFSQYKDAVEAADEAEDNGGDVAPTTHRIKIQGCMWLTGLDSWWYANYYENRNDGVRKLHRNLVPRDDETISEIEAACLDFIKEADERVTA